VRDVVGKFPAVVLWLRRGRSARLGASDLHGYDTHAIFIGHGVSSGLQRAKFLSFFGGGHCSLILVDHVDCGNYSHHDYEALTKYQAHRFMSLLKYLHHTEAKPNWCVSSFYLLRSLLLSEWRLCMMARVRATYTTRSYGFKVDPVFLSSHSPPPTIRDVNAKLPLILHVTPDNFVPSLSANDLEKIDNLLAQRGKAKPAPPSVRDEVTGSKKTRPEVSDAWKQLSPRQCAYCEQHGEKQLSRCSRSV
jgi:hypothetical protein